MSENVTDILCPDCGHGWKEHYSIGGKSGCYKFGCLCEVSPIDVVENVVAQARADSPLVALLKSHPEAARLTLGNKLLHYRQGAFIVLEQKRVPERIIATGDEAEAANALAGE